MLHCTIVSLELGINMASPMRLNSRLIKSAEIAGRCHKRTAPKQIEYWAEIGKRIEQALSNNDLIAVTQGLVCLRLESIPSSPLDPLEIFDAVDKDSSSGNLVGRVTQATIFYEASRSRRGLLDRVHPDGRRETGRFQDGDFIVAV